MLNTDSLRSDLGFIMNVYDSIALLYLHDIADREIIETRVHDAMASLEPILKVKAWPMESRLNFDAALAQMSTQRGNAQNTNTQNERHE